MNTVDLIISILKLAASFAEQTIAGKKLDAVQVILDIAAAANQAHVNETGKPIDVDKLGPIALVE